MTGSGTFAFNAQPLVMRIRDEISDLPGPAFAVDLLERLVAGSAHSESSSSFRE